MINLDDAKEGMVLVEDVSNERGNVLLKKGTALTEDLISTMKSLGIAVLPVDSPGGDGDETNHFSAPTELRELEYRFSDVRDNPLMEELMAASKEHIAARGGNDDTS